MKSLCTISTTYFLAFSMLFSIVEANKNKHVACNEIVKYVQGGACGKGKGTQKHPYTSLAQAQADTSWDTLIVLPSTVALDGGITLRPGTKLIGTEDPTEIALSTTQPTITNSSDATNGGNGVVVTGDATVQNIYFKDTWAAAIRYDDALDLNVKNVLVTGHNQGEVVSPQSPTSILVFEVAAIHGQTIRNGKTKIHNVIVRNNHTGSGIFDQPFDGAQRALHISKYECAELTSVNSLIPGKALVTARGILAAAVGLGSSSNITIEKSYLHDFKAKQITNSVDGNVGVQIIADTGSVTCTIRCSTFSSLDAGEGATNYIEFESVVEGGSGAIASGKYIVDSCLLEEPSANSLAPTTGVQAVNLDGNSELTVKNTTVMNIFDTFLSFILGNGTQTIRLLDNTVDGFETFYGATTQSGSTLPNRKRVTHATIEGNTYRGGVSLGAITVIPNLDGSNNPWDNLTINARNNCFDGQNLGGTGLLGLDFGTAGAGNATINAHNNSIVGYFFDIADFFANVNYFAQRNFWGQGDPCTTGADCATTQICEGGFCVGPDNVVNLGTGIVDVSNPLTKSIKCPHNCCLGIDTTPPQQREAIEAKSKEFEAKLDKLKTDFKARHKARPYGN